MEQVVRLTAKHITMTAYFILSFLICIPSVACAQKADDSRLQALYESHNWLELQRVTQRGDVPLFYRAATEAAFNRVEKAEADLQAVLRTESGAEHAYDAREMLTNLYFRNGLYHEALAELRLMLIQKPGAEDVKATIPLMEALSQAPDMAIVERKISTIPMQMEQGNLFIPLKIGLGSAKFILDSGANFCVMSESEAQRLGLRVGDTYAAAGDSSGSGVKIRVATAANLTIGDLHLKDVSFGVIPDNQEPFADLPEGHRGILGIPVLLAMQVIHWTPKGSFTLGSPEEHQTLENPNVSFVGMFPVTKVFSEKRQMDFTIDMGAVHTDLDPEFAEEFPALISEFGRREQHRITGTGGSQNYASTLLPSVDMLVGGHKVILKPAHVLLTPDNGPSHWAAGNLGMDILNQASSTTLDFGAMTLNLH